jgi:hypothetical protein
MVAGSNPARGASQIKHLAKNLHFLEKPSVCTVSANALRMRGIVMSDQIDWVFAGPDDAIKAQIRAAVGYLLRGATGGARADIVQEIIAIIRDVANGLPPEQPNPLDDDLPGG